MPENDLFDVFHNFIEPCFDQFKAQLGDDFIELGKTTMAETLELLQKGTVAVAQGYLELETEEYFWSGFPDLLLREDFTI